MTLEDYLINRSILYGDDISSWPLEIKKEMSLAISEAMSLMKPEGDKLVELVEFIKSFRAGKSK